MKIEVEDARPAPWTGPEHCCGPPRSPRSSARSTGADGWVTGHPPRAVRRRARCAELVEFDDKRGIWKYNPLADWTEKDLWQRDPRARPALPPAARPGLRVDRLRAVHAARLRPRRAAGPAPTRPSAACMSDARSELTHLRALEAEAIHVMREVAAELEKPVLLFSGGKDSIVLLRLAEKAFRPARFPFPLMHVDTGHNFPEVIEFRDRRVAELGEQLIVASVQESIDNGRVVEETGPARVAQPPADDDAARRDRRARLRRRLRRRPPRRGARPRQGAHLLLPRRLRQLGPQAPAPRAVEPLQRPHPPRRARARLPAVQLDRARRLAVHRRGGARGPVDLLRPRARGLPPRRDALRGLGLRRADGRRGAVHGQRALPDGRRHELHRRGRVRRDASSTTSSPRSPPPASPSAARPAPTTG